MELLTTRNHKIQKGRAKGYIVYGMHLHPGDTCPHASRGCLKACLNTAGRGTMAMAQRARKRRTTLFWEHPEDFLSLLRGEIRVAIRRGRNKGLEPVFRLNLTSDIPWELFGIPQEFPEVQFYDYTKDDDRFPPDNYHLTLSRSEKEGSEETCKQWLDRGQNVAVVFDQIPRTFWGYPVHSGENDDLRFLDPFGVIGLKAKGRAKRDTSGFVVLRRSA